MHFLSRFDDDLADTYMAVGSKLGGGGGSKSTFIAVLFTYFLEVQGAPKLFRGDPIWPCAPHV
jgi:hypothetical protein